VYWKNETRSFRKRVRVDKTREDHETEGNKCGTMEEKKRGNLSRRCTTPEGRRGRGKGFKRGNILVQGGKETEKAAIYVPGEKVYLPMDYEEGGGKNTTLSHQEKEKPNTRNEKSGGLASHTF